MKITLTITGEGAPDEKRIFREIFALLNGSTALTATAPVPVPETGDNDDDDGGTAPVAIAPGEVDASGMPWDERIHSGAKSKTEVGNWRKRKGIDDNVFNTVIAELKARGFGAVAVAPPTVPTPVSVTPPTMAFPPPTAIPAVAAPIPTPVPTPTAIPAAAPIPTPVPVAAPIPTPTPVPVAAPPAIPAVPDFPGIMQVITNAMTGGTMTANYLQQVCQIYGLGDNIANMSDRPDLIAAVWAQLKVDGHAA